MQTSFDPASYEAKWQRFWEEGKYFQANAPSEKPAFCIMIPPPNVTGELHIGHALQSTLQDILTRWRRMQGFNALWLPGTDHASIAVHVMVERELAAEGTDRWEIGREQFVERCWEWTRRHHGRIRRQLNRLGASCDWSRERFTLDEGLTRAVVVAFNRLYHEGLIYRDDYMVNWSPGLQTAVSDLEVEHREVKGSLYRIAYPLEGSEERIQVATTRPETMLGDTAIAFHPEDARYSHLRDEHAILPLVGRRLPFVAADAVDPEFGTGLVKVTPAHDFADFEIGRSHQLESIQVIDRQARMTGAAGPELEGRTREEARELVVDRLQEAGYLLDAQEHVHNVGFCQRSGVAIEPLVSTQWFCNVSDMAARALTAVEEGDLRLRPGTWSRTWEHWLTNIRPWCISRQLWWGHRIPAWYDPDGIAWVAHDAAEAASLAGTDELSQEEDILDTWFSSALWPFSTLGWPEETADLETFYPTDVLITGHDILFFWVARMVMAGLHHTDEVPFHTVHLTGLVRDEHGEKMSKTRGNTVDPLELVEEYGADALRFTLAALDSPGSDIPLDPDRLAGYRAFGNKIWNAVRFVLGATGDTITATEMEPGQLDSPERWILSRLSRVSSTVNEHLERLRFDLACHHLYHFFWDELCDWYLEMAKPALTGDAPRPQVEEVLLLAMDRSLRLLHPAMPFVTEELWQRLPQAADRESDTIALAEWPEPVETWKDDALERQMASWMEIVVRIRAIRAESGMARREPLRLFLEHQGDEPMEELLGDLVPLTRKMAGVETQSWDKPPRSALVDRAAGNQFAVEAPERDLASEDRQRREEEIGELEVQAGQIRDRVTNRQFVEKAPTEVVERNRRRLEELERRVASLRDAG